MMTEEQQKAISGACYKVGSREFGPFFAKIFELENRVQALEHMYGERMTRQREITADDFVKAT